MAVQVISTTELRTDAKRLVIGLRSGDTFLIQHYKEIVGYITPKVPKAILKEYQKQMEEAAARRKGARRARKG